MNVGSILSRILKNTGDDVAGKIGNQYSAANLSKLASSSADDIAATQGNLIATHQLDAHKLGQAADLGGFVQPSMAVVDPSKGTNFLPGGDFGDVVMVANRNAIDPAKKATKTFIGDRDIYSPRFPSVETTVNEQALDDMIKGTGISKQSAMSNLDLDGSSNYDSFVQDLYKSKNPDYRDFSSMELRDAEDFKRFADDAFGQLSADKAMPYYTPGGSRKTLPYTAENANKMMNKGGVVGTEGYFSTPSSNAYHQNTKQMRSLDDLYKNRHRFIDSETGAVTKDAMDGELSRISSDASDNLDSLGLDYLRDPNPYTQNDSVANFIADAASGKAEPGLLERMPQAMRNDIQDLSKAYQDVPVSYFEAKPRRVVNGDEFYGAYIRDDSSPEVMAQLERLGVKNIKKYLDKGDLDLQLASLANEGKRGVSPYVLSMAGALPTAGILSGLLGGGDNEQQMM